MFIVFVIIAIFAVSIPAFLHQPQFGQSPDKHYFHDTLQTSNYLNGKFQNKDGITTNVSFFKAMTLMPKYLNGKGEKFPTHTVPVVKRNKEEFLNFSDSLVRITWFGHSTFLLEIDGKRLMLDPMLGKTPSPFSSFTKRFNDTRPLNTEDIPPLDAVLFSHDHYDHLDYETILKIKDKVGHFFVPLGVGSHLKKWGVEANKITELNWWNEIDFMGLNFVCTPTQHFSGRSLGDRNKTLWCSWVIKGKTKKIFFSGDSGYSNEFKKIGEQYGPFDFCMMECGQYNELWKEIHMLPEETAQAFLDLKGKVLMPIHWGAFSLSLHKWNEPVERLTKVSQSKNITVTTPMIGESVILGEKLPNKKWWLN